MLEDSAQIQEKNIEQENKRRMRMSQKPRLPLYTQDDAKACMPLFSKVEYTKTYKMNENIEVRFQDA
jgi:metallo-beta-lactamase family protein